MHLIQIRIYTYIFSHQLKMYQQDLDKFHLDNGSGTLILNDAQLRLRTIQSTMYHGVSRSPGGNFSSNYKPKNFNFVDYI